MDEPHGSLILSPAVEFNLHKVIKDRNSDAFKKIAQMYHLNCTSSFKHIPPLIALIQHLVQENFVPAVELILSRRTPPFAETHSLRTAFDYAARHELVDIVSLYIRAVLERSIHCISIDEAFHFALEMHLYVLASEVSKDPEFHLNVIPPVRHRRPPLHLAVLSGETRLLDDLLNRGAIVDIEDHRGDTALMLGCSLKSYACCRVLLTHGADPNRRNPTRICGSPFRAVCSSPAESMSSGNLKVRLIQLLQMFGLRPENIAGPKPNVENSTTGTTSGDKASQFDESLQKLRLYDAPPSLRRECCRLIRRHLVCVHHGLSVLKYIDSLPLPPLIIRRYFRCNLAQE